METVEKLKNDGKVRTQNNVYVNKLVTVNGCNAKFPHISAILYIDACIDIFDRIQLILIEWK